MVKLGRFLVVVVVGALLVVSSLALVAPQVGAVLRAGDVAEPTFINLNPLAQRSTILAADGTLLTYLLVEENRVSVGLDEVSDTFVETLLAIEDDRFWDHDGVNVRATARALLTNVSAGGVEQGGSTITQQLVKQALVGNEQSLERKVEEAILARRLEEQMSKEEILERYVNTVYLGNSTYGVEAAAELYFGIPAIELDHAQSALLVGMIQNPARLEPFHYTEEATDRRDEVVGRMLAVELIDDAAADAIQATPVPTEGFSFSSRPRDYFVEEVKEQLLDDERLGATQAERYNTLYRGGLTIRTTLEPRLQALADQAVADVLPDTDGRFTASIVSVDPRTGAVRAMVGGPGFAEAQYNIASGRGGTGRQAGSAFKPFVLATHLAAGGSIEDTIDGEGPCEFDNTGGEEELYTVENFEDARGREDDLRAQTLRSSNCSYVRLGIITGLSEVVDTAKRLGITTDPKANISLALGTSEVHPIDMASAYGVFANGGVRHEPYYVEEVLNRDGEVLFGGPEAGTRVLEEGVAATMADVLVANVIGGTGRSAAFDDGRPAGGKTGTTQDFGDAWFVGFTGELSTAVWMGSPTGNVDKMTNVGGIRVTGGSYPARMWQAFMGPAVAPYEPISFPVPPRAPEGELLQTEEDERKAEEKAAEERREQRRNEERRDAERREEAQRAEQRREDERAREVATTTTSPPTTVPPPTAPPPTTPPTTAPAAPAPPTTPPPAAGGG